MNLFRLLCDDVLKLIFHFLTLKDLENIQLVNKNLSELAMHDEFYKTLYERKLKFILGYVGNTKLLASRGFSVDNQDREVELFYKGYRDRKNNFRNNLLELYVIIEKRIEENLEGRRKLYSENLIEHSVKYQGCEEIKNYLTIDEIQLHFGQLLDSNVSVSVWADRKVGATRFIHKCWSSIFPSYLVLQPSFQFDIYNSKYKTVSKMDVRDSSGYPTITKKDKGVICLLYSVAAPSSFLNIRNRWIMEYQGISVNIPVVLVACKTDLRNDAETRAILRYRYFQTPIEKHEGELMAKSIGCSTYLESSALKGEGNLRDFSEILFKLFIQTYYDDMLPKSPLSNSACWIQ